MNEFTQCLLTVEPKEPALPLTHTCDGFQFRGIIQRSQLLANPCPNFNNNLLVYRFYGRPAYRPDSWKDNSARTMYPYLPCSILLKENSTSSAKRIAPFDTGAYFKGKYKDFFHPGMVLDDFFLDPSRYIQMAQRIVGMFYESNSDYYFDRPGNAERIPPTAFEAQIYHEIIKAKATKNHDDRYSTIEIQTDHSILLDDASVLHVVLPKVFLQDKIFRDTIRVHWKASCSTYEIHQGDLLELMGKVYNCVEKYLRKNKKI